MTGYRVWGHTSIDWYVDIDMPDNTPRSTIIKEAALLFPDRLWSGDNRSVDVEWDGILVEPFDY